MKFPLTKVGKIVLNYSKIKSYNAMLKSISADINHSVFGLSALRIT